MYTTKIKVDGMALKYCFTRGHLPNYLLVMPSKRNDHQSRINQINLVHESEKLQDLHIKKTCQTRNLNHRTTTIPLNDPYNPPNLESCIGMFVNPSTPRPSEQISWSHERLQSKSLKEMSQRCLLSWKTAYWRRLMAWKNEVWWSFWNVLDFGSFRWFESTHKYSPLKTFLKKRHLKSCVEDYVSRLLSWMLSKNGPGLSWLFSYYVTAMYLANGFFKSCIPENEWGKTLHFTTI